MEESVWTALLRLLGRLHPLVVHFPIALLVVAYLLELLTLNGRRKGLKEGIQWMVYIGAGSALLATVFGLFLQRFDDYSGELVQNHQFSGIATTLLAGITAFLLYRHTQGHRQNKLGYRISFFFTIVSLTVAGHWGASLTHGDDFLSSAFPDSNETNNSQESLALLTQLRSSDSLSTDQLDKLNLEVRAIFAHNCYQCHSENKQKGELILENKEGVFKGGESGPVIVKGSPDASELYKRITLSPDHDDVMPKKGKVLKKNEIALIKLWIEQGAYWSDKALKVFPEAPLALNKPPLPTSKKTHPIDKIVDVYFEKNSIEWPEIVNDKAFIRRAYLDVVGLLPSPQAIDQFEKDNNPQKRVELIDQLLEDEHNYTQHWLTFWNDLLRNDYSGTGFITGGRKQITDWLYASLMENKPYQLMVKELVNPTSASEGFIKGIQWRGVVNASQRTEMQAAQNIGQSLMGMNVKCASCHNSFVSNLTLEQVYGFASVFADSVLELNRCDKPIGKMAKVNFLYTELGEVEAATLKERLNKLSEVMTKPANGRLYRTLVNRYWQKLLGRGLVEPADEMDNPPWNSTLLDWLAAEFIDSGYDLKQLIRLIMTSDTYQLPTVGYAKKSKLHDNKYVFEGPTIRRMTAEQFSDAVSQVISPMYHAVAYHPTEENLSVSRIWHHEVKFDRTVLPEPGTRYFRYSFDLPAKKIAKAIALISVDHSYTLYLNGRETASGNDWRKVQRVDMKSSLSAGKNLIAIQASNEGNIANPAGILLAIKVKYEDGDELLIQSNHDWKSFAEEPASNWKTLEFDDLAWDKVRNYGSRHWDKLLAFQFENDVPPFARASLVRQHPFLKALGRPTRENVATSRDDQATLLQALELTNGQFFNGILQEGASEWKEKYKNDTETLARQLYLKSLGRLPSNKEEEVITATLGNNPQSEEIQDLFWTTLLLPEFQFIH